MIGRRIGLVASPLPAQGRRGRALRPAARSCDTVPHSGRRSRNV